ncbi:hypothetical protein [Vibrio phage vB_VmeM-Yong XC32]|nr:hypothetical protein [Vibrio phage vB_VmeM-Yong XC31]QAX96572.1 hypothetical protein [Vibrio phage vB_VmeM-Yong XC32]QAX96890.1 hypothetical protein [Vibrio phage vB_VmeM-Yong MS31]QAX97195.1 hypothetical protein [Vibrio phage vB_VmeM-Yong MS32]
MSASGFEALAHGGAKQNQVFFDSGEDDLGDLITAQPMLATIPAGSYKVGDQIRIKRVMTITPQVNGTRGTKNAYPTGASDQYAFVVENPPSSAFELGSGIGGDTHLYPRIFKEGAGYWVSNLGHSHVVEINHGHEASFSGYQTTINDLTISYKKGMSQAEIDLRQPTYYCNTFMVIY